MRPRERESGAGGGGGEREVEIRRHTIPRIGRADKENYLSMAAGRAAEPEERPTELCCPPGESRAASAEVPRSPRGLRRPVRI